MTIQFVEVSIIKNVNQEPFLKNVCREHLGHEYGATNDDTIVMLFQDGTICDTNYESLSNVGMTFKFNDELANFNFPEFITLESGIKLTYEIPIYDSQSGHYYMKSLNCLFKSHSKYKMLVSSMYNCAYAKNNITVFGILKLKSNVNFQTYLVAFDDDVLDKQQMIYLINYMLKIKKYEEWWLRLIS